MTEAYLAVVASHIGEEYPLLMMELGLSMVRIWQEQQNNIRDMRQTIYSLLCQWRQEEKSSCKLSSLLTTIDFVEIQTDSLIAALHKKVKTGELRRLQPTSGVERGTKQTNERKKIEPVRSACDIS